MRKIWGFLAGIYFFRLLGDVGAAEIGVADLSLMDSAVNLAIMTLFILLAGGFRRGKDENNL